MRSYSVLKIVRSRLGLTIVTRVFAPSSTNDRARIDTHFEHEHEYDF